MSASRTHASSGESGPAPITAESSPGLAGDGGPDPDGGGWFSLGNGAQCYGLTPEDCFHLFVAGTVVHLAAGGGAGGGGTVDDAGPDPGADPNPDAGGDDGPTIDHDNLRFLDEARGDLHLAPTNPARPHPDPAVPGGAGVRLCVDGEPEWNAPRRDRWGRERW